MPSINLSSVMTNEQMKQCKIANTIEGHFMKLNCKAIDLNKYKTSKMIVEYYGLFNDTFSDAVNEYDILIALNIFISNKNGETSIVHDYIATVFGEED